MQIHEKNFTLSEKALSEFMFTRPLGQVIEIFKAQVIGAMITLLIVAIVAHQFIVSFFLGELAMLAGNAFLTYNLYRQHKNLAPKALFLRFILGEFGKYIILIIMTIIFAKIFSLNWIAYAVGVFTLQVFGIVVYVLLNRFKKR